MGTPYKLEVNGQWSYEMEPGGAGGYDIARLDLHRYHILKGPASYAAHVLQADMDRKTYRVEVNGNPYTVRISDDLDQRIAEMGFALHSSRNVSRVEAPMPGLILDIQVAEGQEVGEGDPLVVLEAMKMENAILSPRDGVIRRIAVQKGQAVDKKALLVEFE